MAVASMTMSMQSAHAVARPRAASSHTSCRTSALPLFRPSVHATRRRAAFRPAAQWSSGANGPGFKAKWSCGPNGFYWDVGAGPQSAKNMNELWKEFEKDEY